MGSRALAHLVPPTLYKQNTNKHSVLTTQRSQNTGVLGTLAFSNTASSRSPNLLEQSVWALISLELFCQRFGTAQAEAALPLAGTL